MHGLGYCSALRKILYRILIDLQAVLKRIEGHIEYLQSRSSPDRLLVESHAVELRRECLSHCNLLCSFIAFSSPAPADHILPPSPGPEPVDEPPSHLVVLRHEVEKRLLSIRIAIRSAIAAREDLARFAVDLDRLRREMLERLSKHECLTSDPDWLALSSVLGEILTLFDDISPAEPDPKARIDDRFDWRWRDPFGRRRRGQQPRRQ